MAITYSFSTFWNCLLTLGGLSLLLIVARITYNLLFHPLAKVPGPLFASISGIPSWYHAIRGDRHIWIWQLNQIYGIKFRIEPNAVVFCDPTSYNDIYSNTANVQRSSFYTALQRSHNERNTVTTADFHTHAKKRKLLNLSFTEKSLRAASTFMITHIDRWIELIAEDCTDSDGWSSPKDFSELANILLFDIMGDLSFGKSPGIKEPGDNPLKPMPHNIAKYLKFLYPIARSPFREFMLWLRPRGLDALMNLLTPPEIKAYYKFVDDSITERTALQASLEGKPEAQQRLDMFHFLISAKDPDTGLPAYTKEELWAEASMLIVAGADTTAISLSGVIFYLVRDDIRMGKLVQEIRSTFSSADDIVPGSELQSCVYLKAVIDEGMRLAPAGLSELSREVRAGGTTINGEHYPAGVIVGAASWSQSRNHVYGDPCIFRPERWIVDKDHGVTAESIALLRSNFNPFSKGPLSCPGKNMALLELMLTVAKTLWWFEVRKPIGDTLGEGSMERLWGQRESGLLQMRDAYISIPEGVNVQFRKRKM